MNAKSAVKGAAQIISDPLETLTSQTIKPFADEAFSELAFFSPKKFGRDKTLAQEELSRARNEQKIKDLDQKDQKNTQERINMIRQEYKMYDIKISKEDDTQNQQIAELEDEIAELVKGASAKTKIHIENTPKKAGTLHLKLLISIVRYLRLKAKESKSAEELVAQRKNAKPATGMLAWVSGKQMKVHEQGTLQLQG